MIKRIFGFLGIYGVVFIMSCTGNSNKKYQTTVSIMPDHKPFIEFPDKGIESVQEVDNDGNLYVFHWNVDVDKKDKFVLDVYDCRKSIKTWLFRNKILGLNNFDPKELKPINYKKYVQCVSDKGYMLKASKGFLPGGFKVKISKEFSGNDVYLPVGESIYIESEDMDLSAAYQKVSNCDQKSKLINGRSSEVRYIGGFMSVSIEKYVAAMKECLNEYRVNKIVENINN